MDILKKIDLYLGEGQAVYGQPLEADPGDLEGDIYAHLKSKGIYVINSPKFQFVVKGKIDREGYVEHVTVTGTQKKPHKGVMHQQFNSIGDAADDMWAFIGDEIKNDNKNIHVGYKVK